MKPEDFETFANLVRQRSGLVLPVEKAYLLESRLDGVARKHSLKSLEDMANALRGKRDDSLITDITEALTDTETWFFRDRAVFRGIGENILPRLIQQRGHERHLRLWSAGAASGQEAYSLAMLCAEASGAMPGWTVDLLATDLSRAACTRAKSGTYSQFEVQRGLPVRLLVRYFGQIAGDKWQIDDRMRQAVKFVEANLFGANPDNGVFDLICCRYVLHGFDGASRTHVLDSFAQAMRPGAVLVLAPGDGMDGHGMFDRHATVAGAWVRKAS